MTPSPEEVFGKSKIDAVRALHAEQIKPDLLSLDVERIDTVKHHRLLKRVSAILSVPSLIYVIYSIFRLDGHDIDAAMFTSALVVFSVGILVLVLVRWPEELRRGVKQILTGPIIETLGYRYDKNGLSIDTLGAPLLAKELGLLKKHDVMSCDEYVAGHRSGFDFEMLEVQLSKTETHKGRAVDMPFFWGQCFLIHFDKPFYGTTIATRHSDITSFRRRPPGLTEVRLEAKALPKAFRISSDDQVEARFLLTPDILERLLDLETRLKGKKLRFGFRRKSLVIVIESANMFDPDPYKQAYASDAALDKILNDMAAIASLFDTLAAARHRDTHDSA